LVLAKGILITVWKLQCRINSEPLVQFAWFKNHWKVLQKGFQKHWDHFFKFGHLRVHNEAQSCCKNKFVYKIGFLFIFPI